MKPPVHGRRAPPPNYQSRSVQLRLLCLVFALMTVVLLMIGAAKPRTWQAMWGDRPLQPPPAAVPTEDDLDNRLYREPRESQPPVVQDSEVTPASPAAEAAAAFPGAVPRTAYRVVQDDTVFRADEHDVWFATLAALAKAPPADLATADPPAVGFTQLFRQPEYYRGTLVAVSGTVRRAHRLKAPKNDQGVAAYWQCWLFPAGTTNPIVVYALELPAEFPSGLRLNEKVAFQGVFFKRWAYAASDGERTAPLVLAPRGTWTQRPSPSPPWRPRRSAAILSVVGSGLLSALIAWLAYRQSARGFSRRRPPPLSTRDPSASREGLPPVGIPPLTFAHPPPGEQLSDDDGDARKDAR